MPIPTKNAKETKEKFIERCMSSEVMKREFPRNDQRFAVCMSQFKKKKK